MSADLKERMIQDGRTAARILLRIACDDKTDRSTSAAIYAMRVGIAPTPACKQEALLRGTNSSSLLLRILSWRRLVQETDIPLPAWTDRAEEDPAVRILAALAHVTRNLPLSDDLVFALSLPSGSLPRTDKKADVEKRMRQLAAAAEPFDEGLSAAAIGFAESVYEETAEPSGDQWIWSAARLRQSMLDALGIRNEQIPAPTAEMSDTVGRRTVAGEALDNPLARRPLKMLSNIALNAPPALRIQALRAVVIRGGPPSAADLAVAAAALRSDDADVQMEGARTFLLLIRRIGK